MKVGNIIIIVLLAGIVCYGQAARAEEIVGYILPEGSAQEINAPIIPKPKAREIASRQAKRLGYDTSMMEARCDEKNTAWVKWSNQIYIDSNGKKSSMLDTVPKIKANLKGRNYWAVYYQPKGWISAGDVFVFVDKDTGELIDSLRLQ